MTRLATPVFLAALLLSAGRMDAATFDLQIDFAGPGESVVFGGDTITSDGFSARQRQLIGAAENFWESVITGFDGASAQLVSITALRRPIDGLNNILANAAPTMIELAGSNPLNGGAGYFRATEGFMQFDSADYGPRGDQSFLDVAIHEIAHVLGFGTLFLQNGLEDTFVLPGAPTEYIGPEAVSVFNALNGSSVSSILLDDGGGHWNECYVAGLGGAACSDDKAEPDYFNDAELMTTFAPLGSATMSPVTIAALRDLGYTTTLQQSYALPVAAEIPAPPIPLPAAGWLLLAGVGGLGLLRRRPARKCS